MKCGTRHAMDYAFARRLTLPMHRQDTRVHIGPVRIHSGTDNVSFAAIAPNTKLREIRPTYYDCIHEPSA